MSEFLDGDLYPLYKSEPPFMSYKDGFGYYGVILQSISTGKIQCHVCGGLYKSVTKHIWHKHNRMNCEEYREMVGLSNFTPLVCENTSNKIRDNFINLNEKEKKNRVKLLQSNNKKLHSSGKFVKRHKKNAIQYNNKFGTCDLQIKYKFYKIYKNLGRIPTWKELDGGIRSVIELRIGSYYDALKLWGISDKKIQEKKELGKKNSYLARKEKDFFPKYNKDEVIAEYENYLLKNKRLPTWKEVKNFGFASRSVCKRVFGSSRKDVILQKLS